MQQSNNLEITVKEFEVEKPMPEEEESPRVGKVVAIVAGLVLMGAIALFMTILSSNVFPDSTDVIEEPKTINEPQVRTFTPTCGPFFAVAAPGGVMNITYELGYSTPFYKPAIRISAATTSSGYGAVGFRNVHNSSIGHMYGIDVVAFDRRGVQDMVITTQPGPPARAPLPSIVVQDQLIVGNLIFARYFRDLQTNSSYDMPLFKGMMINVAYSLGVGQVGLNWQHHMFAGSQNITLQNC